MGLPNTQTLTKIVDVIVPEIFNPYFREQSTRVNAFFTSGIIARVPDLSFANRGGTRIHMPFWHTLTGRAQLLDDNEDLDIRKITAGQDEAVQHARAFVFGASDLSGAFAGSDPMTAIGNQVADKWSEEMTAVLMASLQGALGSLSAESDPVNTLDISALSGDAGQIDGSSFIDAAQQLGDAKGKIAAVAMHSAVEAHLAKNDLIEYLRDSEGKLLMSTFMGKQVIVDDVMAPESGGVFTSILFGEGAVGFGEGNPKVPTAVDRDELKAGGEEFLVSRRHFVMHPRGIAWNPVSGVPANATPSDAELADPSNWARAYERKNIRIVRMVHNIG